jgi:hypothetical protein
MVQALEWRCCPCLYQGRARTYTITRITATWPPRSFTPLAAAPCHHQRDNVGQPSRASSPAPVRTDVQDAGFSSGLSATYSSILIAVTNWLKSNPERKVSPGHPVRLPGQGLSSIWPRGFRSSKKHREVRTVRGEQASTSATGSPWMYLMYLKRVGPVSAATAVVGTMSSQAGCTWTLRGISLTSARPGPKAPGRSGEKGGGDRHRPGEPDHFITTSTARRRPECAIRSRPSTPQRDHPQLHRAGHRRHTGPVCVRSTSWEYSLLDPIWLE